MEIELTLRELAQYLGVPQSTIEQREGGKILITKEAELALRFVAYRIKADWASAKNRKAAAAGEAS